MQDDFMYSDLEKSNSIDSVKCSSGNDSEVGGIKSLISITIIF